MIWHPLTWIFWTTAATGTLLYAIAAARSLDVFMNWSPDRVNADQLRRERRAETAALLGRGALTCLTIAAGVGLAGIALVWHRTIPGAMCGTGVLQAMGASGTQALIFWTAAFAILYGWHVVARLDDQHPQGLQTRAASRMLIVAAPFVTLALFFSWQALMGIDGITPVSCCAAVYDQALRRAPLSASRWTEAVSMWGTLAGSAALMVLAIAAIRSPQHAAGAALALILPAWGTAAVLSVKLTWSAYYYQVLSHPCPWCLFLPEYYGAGFLIFGCLAFVLAEGVAIGLAGRVRRRCPLLAPASAHRIRQAGWRIAIALVGFSILTLGPAVAWRLRTGVWLQGTP